MRGTSNHEAFQAFVAGAHQYPVDTQEQMDLAVDRFRHAIGIDSNFARAHAWLAYSYMTAWVGRWGKPAELVNEPELLDAMCHHAKLAAELDPFDYSIRWSLMNVRLLSAKRRSDPAKHYQLGRQQLAWADYLHQGESDPIFLPERMLALCYLGLHEEVDDAIERARPVMALRAWASWSVACALYARALHEPDAEKRRGRYERALFEINPVVEVPKRRGHIIEAWLIKAMCHARLEQKSAAATSLAMFVDDFEATRPGQPRWSLSDEDASVGFARGADRRHWIEGMALVIDGNPSLMPLVPDPDGIGTPDGLAKLEKEDYPTVPADPVP
jgi:hypothetical protein